MSEIARLRQQIELECQAMTLAMNGFAAVARHQIITHKYDQLGKYQDELEKIVGEEEATRIVTENYIKVME